MHYKFFLTLLISFSVRADEGHKETLRNATNFYQETFISQLTQKEESEELKARKAEILKNTTGCNGQEDLNSWQICVQNEAVLILDARQALLKNAAQQIRTSLEKKYGIDSVKLWWSRTLLKEAAKKAIQENQQFFNQLNFYENEPAIKNLVQQLVEVTVTEFACAYGAEAGCKGMGLRRFLFGQSVAYYLRGGQERDPFERVD